ncbi:iron complex outermembrane receptor protein [Mucilaginibacter oryzae]|uniref:Iron complex outermembrane receptor protein n=1 Tax=Mucilaginibacter oryzae TaxID=468058 RepID=A0A316H1P7_9SPHI|nr:TonB-dependent receptor [Mucilaginibacter oryzae]PWK73777.1 iron complex outermembrane receptor protein [Mucilaginibacter oryzae]
MQLVFTPVKFIFRISFKLLLLAITPVLFFALSAAAQTAPGTIKGTVKTSDGKPAEFVNIVLTGTPLGATAGQTGHFTIKNVAAGTYTITASYIGLQTQTKQVTVAAGETAYVHFVLTEGAKDLEEVYVKSAKHNKFLKKETEDVARLPLKNLENPQVYSVVTSELMKEQVVTSYADGFKNIPGTGVPLVYNNGRTTLLSRGFVTGNFIRNSVAGYNFNSIDPADIEKIEAIKGPTGTLYNSSLASFGGLFNRVTKQPNETPRTEIAYQTGSFDLNRLTADVNVPLNKDKTVLFRVNAALHNEHSFQDAGFNRGVFVAPSITYHVNDRLTVDIDAEIGNSNATSAYRLAPDTKGKIYNVKDLGIDYKRSFANNSVDYLSRQIDLYLLVNYKISGSWKSQTMFNKTFSTTKGMVTAFTLADTAMKRQVTQEDYPYYITNVQQNFIGDFKIGRFRNRIVAGMEYYNQKSNNTNVTVSLPAINYLKPGAAYNSFTADKVSALVSAAAPKPGDYVQNNQSSYAAYVSDVFNITDRLNAMASIRIDRFVNKGAYTPADGKTTGNFSQTAWSPKFGLVYQLVKDQVSLFGNYMNGLNNVTGSSFDNTPFKPQYANQWEAGVKIDAWDHKISSTLSYYDISVTNTTMVDPDHPAFNIQAGTQLSKGFEAELIANPFSGFNIIAGFAYNNSKITNGDASIVGLRPANSGPARLANLWMSYRITHGAVQGLGVGVGGNYGSDSYQTNTKTFKFTIPSYTTVDATVFYDQPKYRLGFKLDNLTNEKYWSFRLAPQNPTRGTLSVSVKF